MTKAIVLDKMSDHCMRGTMWQYLMKNGAAFTIVEDNHI